MASKGSIWASIGLNTDKFKKSLLDLQVRSKSLGSSMKRGLSGINPLTLGVAAGFAAIGGAVANAVNVVNDFSKAQSEVEAVLGELGTNKAMEQLSNQAKSLGASTAFTATEVSNLQTELAKLGFDPTAIQQMSESTLDAAAALGSELGEQAALTGATLKGFNLDASQAAKVNDVLAKAASSSALDFSKLSTALPIVSATAKTAGVSLERTTALLGTLSDRGIDASTSSTALRNIFLELSKQGLTYNEAMAKINNSTDKNATAMELFGKRGATVGVILSETKGDVDALTESLEESDGAAKKMADTMLNNLSGDITKAGSAWEGFILSLEDGNGVISKVVRNATQEFTSLLSKITALNEGGLDGLGLNIVQSARGMDEEIKGLGVTYGELTAAMANNENKANSLVQSFKNKTKNSMAVKEELLALAKGVKELTEEEKHEAALSQKRANLNKSKLFSDEEQAAFKTATAVKKLSKAEEKLIEARLQMKKEQSLFVPIKPVATNTDALPAIKELNEKIDSDPKARLHIPAKVKLEIDAGVEDKLAKMTKLGEDLGMALSSSMQGAASGALVGLGEAIGAGSIADFGQQLIGGFANLLKSFGEQMIQLGLAMLALKLALSLGPLGAGVAIGAGVALVAAASAIQSNMAQSSAKPFANGGIVGSPTLGLVGEYAGARHNPEVIAPLDKLQSMMGGSGNMQEIRVTGKLVGRGKDMIGIINEAVKVNKYSS